MIPLTLKTIPFAHQLEVYERSRDMEFYALLMEMGTGKSKVSIDTIAHLYVNKQINGAFILAPKGVYLNWIKNEVPIHMPDEVDYCMEPWSSVMGKEATGLLEILVKGTGNLDILVMNVEALVSDRAMKVATDFLKNHKAITIIDESTCIKNPQASRTKKSFALAKLSKYRRIMTGTPITQSPLDLFAQFQFLKLGCLKFTSFTAFRAYYAKMVMVSMGNRMFPKIDGYRNLEQLQKDIAPYSYRKLKTECLDLPDKLYETHYIQLTPEQEKIYEKFKEEALIELESELITSTSALTTIMRLQQIACGHITTDEKTIVDIPNNRMAALDEVIEAATGKIIIWANFKHDVELIVDHLDETKEAGYPVHYYGGTSDTERVNALYAFEHDPNCRYFVGTPGTGGRGLTLVQSHTTIYYSNGYNLEQRLQSEDRNHRIGQKNTCTIIDITCEKTVDERIVKLLRAKKNLADLVLDTYRDLLT